MKKGSWVGNGLTSQAITGVGFVPKALICWGTDAGATDTITADASISIGFATRRSAATQMQCAAHYYQDAVATSVNNIGQHPKLLDPLNSAGLDYTVSLSTFDADGFTVAYSVATNNLNHVFHYLAIGGTTLADANVVLSTIPTSGATFDVLGFGFQPDAIVAITSSITVANATGGTGGVGMGVVDTSGNERGIYINSRNAQTMAASLDNSGYFSTTSALAVLSDAGASTVIALADFNSWQTDGVRFNLTTAPATAREIMLLGLKGGLYTVGSQAKTTAANAETYTTSAVQPKGVLLFAADDVTSAGAVATTGHDVCIGGGSATDGTAEGSASGAISATINTQGSRQQSTTKALAFLTKGAPATLQTAADLTALSTAGSFNLTWSATGTAELVGFMAMGDTAPAAAAALTPDLMHRAQMQPILAQ